MSRTTIVNTVGSEHQQGNVETGEWSYISDAGSKKNLVDALGGQEAFGKLMGGGPERYKLDLRFLATDDNGTTALLVETKQEFTDNDVEQLAIYVAEEKALHPDHHVVAMLASTTNDSIRVWKSKVDDRHELKEETRLDAMAHYQALFAVRPGNDREAVMRNTYALNEKLHKKDIAERLRSQFVGTCLLYVKDEAEKHGGGGLVDEAMAERLKKRWETFSAKQIRDGIGEVLDGLLDGSKNKEKKIQLLQRDVLDDQKVRDLTKDEWVDILQTILKDIYRYIDADSSEGQDILNLFFITFNKYVGKADKNQAFTPDHITEFMTRVVNLSSRDTVVDCCAGSGSFLVQSMVRELAEARCGSTDAQFKRRARDIKERQIYGIEVEEKAYGLATTNMLIHGDGNSNVELGSCFNKADFIGEAKPDVFLLNPPYNAKPRSIPESVPLGTGEDGEEVCSELKSTWSESEKKGKSDPTKGLVFVKYLSDIAKYHGWRNVRLSVLLPMAAAIGTGKRIASMKDALLKDNTLEAVFSLPPEIFYPGASVQVCCIVLTLNEPHYDENGSPRKETFFGYYKDDGFIKRKNLGRIEQFDDDGESRWRSIEDTWLNLYLNKKVEPGLSAAKAVSGADEWLAEAYMETNYSTLSADPFKRTLRSHLAYLVSAGKMDAKAWPYLELFTNPAGLTNPIVEDTSLNTSTWSSFALQNLFDIKKGKRLTAEDQTLGDTIYVGAIDSNNGVAAHIGQKPIHAGNTISLSYNGSVGEAFYQPDPYWATDDVNALYLRPEFGVLNRYTALFLCGLLRMEQYRFSWGRKWTLDSMNASIIKLPVDVNGQPDWPWIERFMMSLSEDENLSIVS